MIKQLPLKINKNRLFGEIHHQLLHLTHIQSLFANLTSIQKSPTAALIIGHFGDNLPNQSTDWYKKIP